MANSKSSDTGYKKPPQQHRFKPGQSGNPKGRPQGSCNFTTALDKELNTRVTVTEGGKRKKITKREVIAKQLVNKATSGDPKAIPIVLNEARQIEDGATGGSVSLAALSRPEDDRVIDHFVERLLASTPLPPEEAPPASPGTETPEGAP